MVAKSENVKELINWLNARYQGRCNTVLICSFYASHPHLNRKRLGSLRAICKKFKASIDYKREGNDCFITTIGKLPLTVSIQWSDQACISSSFIESVKEADVAVNTVNFSSKGLDFYAFRERKKAVSKENRDELKVDHAAVDDLLASNDSLVMMARSLNIAYVDFAIAVLGWEFIDSEREAIDIYGPPHLLDRKHQLLREALIHAKDDTISGYKLCIKSEGEMRQKAVKGENVLEAELKRALDLAADIDYTTEESTKNALVEGAPIPLTPDVLFKTPQIILGKVCHWAEAKHSVVLPGVSPDRIIADIKRQTDKYVEAFGPGLILWTKCGFSDSIRAELSEEILHVVPSNIGLKYRQLVSANPQSEYGNTRNGYTSNSFFQSPSYLAGNSFPNAAFNSAMHGTCPPYGRQPLSRTWLRPGELLGGDAGIDEATGRSRLLDRLTEEADAARLNTTHPPGSAEDDEDDGFTLMLTRMFASPEDEVELQMTKLNVYVKLLRLNDAGIKAITLVSKVLHNILQNPADEKFRSVKIVNTLSACPTAVKLLHGLGFEKIVEEPRLRHTGDVNTSIWTPFLAALTSATAMVECSKATSLAADAVEPECTSTGGTV